MLAATALALGGLGLVLNSRYASSFGQSAEAARVLAGVGLAIDVLAVVLPVAAGDLWRQRRFVAAGGAWSIWLVALCMTLLAASGFASTQIGDAVAGRSRSADQAVGLTERLHRLRTERAQVHEARAVVTIDAEIQAAQGAVPGALWRATGGCADVTRGRARELARRSSGFGKRVARPSAVTGSTRMSWSSSAPSCRCRRSPWAILVRPWSASSSAG